MYSDAVKRWSVGQGCLFGCVYCVKSFQAQAKRQLHNCERCYYFTPHFHPERLRQPLPTTSGDQFIWAWASGDFSFAEPEWMKLILKRVSDLYHKQFFFQTKKPSAFSQYDWPKNVWRGITLETNRDVGYNLISKAPSPSVRYALAIQTGNIDIVTIEPILEFDLEKLVDMVRNIDPMRVYVGFDTKNCNLPEPSLDKVMRLIHELGKFTIVKPKLLRGSFGYIKQQTFKCSHI